LIFRAVEDADLIHKARKGDVDAFNLLVSRWDRRVYNYILRLVNSREDALDLSQDTFLKAYQNLKKLEDVSRFAPWIFRIAHNEAYSLLRRRRPEVDSDEGLPPDRVIHREFPVELSIAAAAALDRLSADHRDAVVLKVYQGFKFEEISEILEVPVSTVKSRLYTALDLLKTELSPVAGLPKGRSIS